jgi:hypothetical protein
MVDLHNKLERLAAPPKRGGLFGLARRLAGG